MRFLFECVSCYGAAQLDPTEGFSKSSAATVEETRHLVSPFSPVEDSVAAAAAAPCTLRRRSRSLSRQGTGDWKPSLHAISEDIAVAPVKARANAPGQITRVASTATARRSGRRCAASAPSVHSRGRDDSYRRDSLPTIVIPAFAPTPFMF